MRKDLLLETLPNIGETDGGERPRALAAPEGQDEMIERANPLEGTSHAGTVGGIHGKNGKVAL